MTNEEYFSTPALSKSQIKQYNPRNPSKFWTSCTFNPNRKDIELNDAMVQGQLYHACLFERAKVMDMFVVNDGLGKMRSNKKWQAAQAETEKTIITTEELNRATMMIEAMQKHQIIKDLLSTGFNEQPFFWHDETWDIDCKAKLDHIHNTEEGIYVIDYKSTGKIDENTRYIDKGGVQYDVGFYARAVMAKYKQPMKKFIFIYQSTKEGEENDIRIKVVEGPQLEACIIATDCIVREIVAKIKEWQKTKSEAIWLPEIVAEPFEVSPWYDKSLAEMIHKGE